MDTLPPCVSRLANAIPEAIMYGSDWPRTDYHIGLTDEPNQGKKVDQSHDQLFLKRASSEKVWRSMCIETPARLLL